jgi:hypothetical protein
VRPQKTHALEATERLLELLLPFPAAVEAAA